MMTQHSSSSSKATVQIQQQPMESLPIVTMLGITVNGPDDPSVALLPDDIRAALYHQLAKQYLKEKQDNEKRCIKLEKKCLTLESTIIRSNGMLAANSRDHQEEVVRLKSEADKRLQTELAKLQSAADQRLQTELAKLQSAADQKLRAELELCQSSASQRFRTTADAYEVTIITYDDWKEQLLATIESLQAEIQEKNQTLGAYYQVTQGIPTENTRIANLLSETTRLEAPISTSYRTADLRLNPGQAKPPVLAEQIFPPVMSNVTSQTTNLNNVSSSTQPVQLGKRRHTQAFFTENKEPVTLVGAQQQPVLATALYTTDRKPTGYSNP